MCKKKKKKKKKKKIRKKKKTNLLSLETGLREAGAEPCVTQNRDSLGKKPARVLPAHPRLIPCRWVTLGSDFHAMALFWAECVQPCPSTGAISPDRHLACLVI